MPKIAGSTCPCCKRVLDGASCLEDEKLMPNAGDITICIYCLTILEFDNNLKLLEMTNEQISELPHEMRMDLNKIRHAITVVMTDKK